MSKTTKNQKNVITIPSDPYAGLKVVPLNEVKASARKKRKEAPSKETIITHYVNGAFCEILNDKPASYKVQFIDKDNGQILYESNIASNSWAKCSFQYFINWRIDIEKNGKKYKSIELDLENKKVFVSFESKSLGDTLSWFPYVEEFRKKHNCKLVVSTFHNYFFEAKYPDIKFVPPGTTELNLTAMYQIGWFYNGDSINFYKNPLDPKLGPMQKTSSDILGLDFQEIKPQISFNPGLNPLGNKKYVTIAIHSTAQIKYWNREGGWQAVTDYLKEKGYEVVLISSEGLEYMGNKAPDNVSVPENYEMQTIMNYIHHSEFFMGVGSGLTWLAWVLNRPVALISGFSEKWTEMQESKDVVRIGTPEGLGLSTGYFNKYKLDAGDWNWYPGYKGTPRAFEDTKSITPEAVIEAIQPFVAKTAKTKTKSKKQKTTIA